MEKLKYIRVDNDLPHFSLTVGLEGGGACQTFAMGDSAHVTIKTLRGLADLLEKGVKDREAYNAATDLEVIPLKDIPDYLCDGLEDDVIVVRAGAAAIEFFRKNTPIASKVRKFQVEHVPYRAVDNDGIAFVEPVVQVYAPGNNEWVTNPAWVFDATIELVIGYGKTTSLAVGFRRSELPEIS